MFIFQNQEYAKWANGDKNLTQKSPKRTVSKELFREWLKIEKGLSHKAAGDAISRLNRSDFYEEIDPNSDLDSYIDSFLANPEVKNIPISSQKSMIRAVNLFFEYYKSSL